ncbi:MAG TPA: M48 family metallopeptidase [Chthoniobacterales bacterium]|nr:M48 family metallopeptidase [Chthoniobacterales bacterium]
MRCVAVLLLVLTFAASAAVAQESSPAPTLVVVPAAAQNVSDPVAATRAWLDTVPTDKRERSDAYFEGGYWLILWNFLLSAAMSLLLLGTRISARMRDFAERTSRFKFVQVLIYAVPYILITSLLAFPFTAYQSFFREHAYGMATQTFGQWFAEQLKGLALSLVMTPLALGGLYAVFRRAPRTWWIWGTAVVLAFMVFGMLIGPVYIQPLFNTYKPLTDPAISEPILELARANNIPVTQVFEVDASRQTKRISANVSGFLGTTRIALNDNLLTQCTLPEIRHVMGHEMGHYVLNHTGKLLLMFGSLFLVSFAVARVSFGFAVKRWGDKWGVRGIADPAGLPLLMLIFSTVLFVLTPIRKTVTRVVEAQADAFALDKARQPDAAAAVALKLGSYRKLDPGPLEEFVFFDHPSGRARIQMAMEWKAANQANQ